MSDLNQPNDCDDRVVGRPNIIALVPAYNEERYIGSVVLQAANYVDLVIVVDDGSADNTTAVARDAGALVLTHQTNGGKGAALNSGFRKARELGVEALVLLDGDGQHQPKDIPAMLEPILADAADMVVGSRFLELESDIPNYRRVGQTIVTAMTNTSSGIASTDSWSGYRAFSRRAIKAIHFGEGGWGVDPEFQFKAREHKLRLAEVPIVAVYEEPAKRNPIPHGLKTVNAILRLTSQHRPLMYFGITGLTTILVGMIVGTWVIVTYNSKVELAVGFALITVLLLVVGTFTLFTGVILNTIRVLFVEFGHSEQASGPDVVEHDGRVTRTTHDQPHDRLQSDDVKPDRTSSTD